MVQTQPEEAADKARSEYKDVVVGGDVWMVLEEIMMYMRNPMKYHNKRVKLPRVLLSQACIRFN
jgi:cell division protease FtsH